MRKAVQLFLMLYISIICNSVLAAESFIYKEFGQIGQASVVIEEPSSRISVIADLSVDGSGINQTASLRYWVITEYANDGLDSQFWQGDIPVDTVTIRGIASMSVDIDTCDVSNVSGCGYVNFTVTTDPGTPVINNTAFGWNLFGIIYRSVGASQVRNASSTGSVLGYPLETSEYAFVTKSNDLEITITVGN